MSDDENKIKRKEEIKKKSEVGSELHSKSKQAQGLTPKELVNSISKKFNQNKGEFNNE